MPGWQELLIILVIVALIFGTKKLRGIGGDLGGAVKGFKDSMQGNNSDDAEQNSDDAEQNSDQQPTNSDSDPTPPKA